MRPDGLPPLLFKRVKHAVIVPLFVFRPLLSVGCVPDDWENAGIIPVQKKGSTSMLTNYRPISITCVPCKLLECIVVSKIYNRLVYNNIYFIVNSTVLCEGCLHQWSFRGGTRRNAVPIVKNLPERIGTAFRNARERRSHC